MSQRSDDALEAFAKDLSRLCRTYGFGLDSAQVYEMERDDYLFDYSVDDCGKLLLGGSLGDANRDPRIGAGGNPEGRLKADGSSHISEEHVRIDQ